jgi:hypothetical protein
MFFTLLNLKLWQQGKETSFAIGFIMLPGYLICFALISMTSSTNLDYAIELTPAPMCIQSKINQFHYHSMLTVFTNGR